MKNDQTIWSKLSKLKLQFSLNIYRYLYRYSNKKQSSIQFIPLTISFQIQTKQFDFVKLYLRSFNDKMIFIQCNSQTYIYWHNIFKTQQIGRNLEKSHKRKKDYEESCKKIKKQGRSGWIITYLFYVVPNTPLFSLKQYTVVLNIFNNNHFDFCITLISHIFFTYSL